MQMEEDADMTPEELEKLKEEERKKGKAEAEQEFAEAMAKKEQDAKDAELKEFCETMQKEGKLTPADMEGGFLETLKALSRMEATADFSEGEKKASALNFMMDSVKNSAPKVEFGEHATKGKDPGNITADKFEQEVERIAKEQGTNYASAVSFCQEKNPELYQAYIQGV
jgi:hypothetical protein